MYSWKSLVENRSGRSRVSKIRASVYKSADRGHSDSGSAKGTGESRSRILPNMEFSRKGTLQEVEKDHFVLMEGGDAT